MINEVKKIYKIKSRKSLLAVCVQPNFVYKTLRRCLPFAICLRAWGWEGPGCGHLRKVAARFSRRGCPKSFEETGRWTKPLSFETATSLFVCQERQHAAVPWWTRLFSPRAPHRFGQSCNLWALRLLRPRHLWFIHEVQRPDQTIKSRYHVHQYIELESDMLTYQYLCAIRSTALWSLFCKGNSGLDDL